MPIKYKLTFLQLNQLNTKGQQTKYIYTYINIYIQIYKYI